MTKKQFLWINILMSSNILLIIGIVLAVIIALIASFVFFIESNTFYILLYVFYLLLYALYIITKVFLCFILTINKFKNTFSYKLLKRMLKNYSFRRKVLCKAFIWDLIFNFFVLNIILVYLFNFNEPSLMSFDNYLLLDLIIYIIAGGGVFLSYLIYISYYEIIEILKIKIF